MALFSELAELCRRLAATPGRLGKRRLVAEYIRGLPATDVASAVAFLTGRPFPASDPRVLNARGLPAVRSPEAGPPLTLAEVGAAFGEVAEAGGAGARRLRDERLATLAGRASDLERAILGRIIGGEMRTGVSDGLVLEAIGEAAGAGLAAVRRAALFLGDLSAVAVLARSGGAPRAARRTRRARWDRSRRHPPFRGPERVGPAQPGPRPARLRPPPARAGAGETPPMSRPAAGWRSARR